MDGILVINKEKGVSCQNTLNILKKRFNTSKLGHNGTLDPDASGVMVVCMGKATKLIKNLETVSKTYIARIVFGYDSDTLDFYGNITNDIKMDVTLASLEEALKEVCSLEEQIPPLTSAIKVDGHKLWWYQKNNIQVDVKKRKVKVIDYKICSDLEMIDNHYEISIELHVEKGYYIRSFARDLGQALDGCAILKDLNRTKNGSFRIEESVKALDATVDNIVSIIDYYKDLERLEVSEYIAKLVKNGVVLDSRQIKTTSNFFVTYNKEVIALYEVVGDYQYKPLILF